MAKDLYHGLVVHSGNGSPAERIQFLIEFFRSIKDQEIFTEQELQEIYEAILKISQKHQGAIESMEHI
jgi:hypothetical protein